MPDTMLRLTDQKVLSHADNCLAPHLPLEAEGYACTADALLKVLLGVVANQGTIESVCADLLGTPDLTPRQVRRPYRRRFGIESSYRCAGQARGWAISPTPAYLALALSFVLLNIYVHICWLDTQGKAIVHREWKESLAASGELVIILQ